MSGAAIRYDSTRQHAPLMAAADAIMVDTTGMTVEQVMERVRWCASGWRDVRPRCQMARKRRIPLGRILLTPVLHFLMWILVRVKVEALSTSRRRARASFITTTFTGSIR